ncbi:hypothetical protein CAPTEDRAFT_210456 [Capitella teleta]|uniref:Uncharacterized protein n=1 Tax=Capitella teleta TaxID=283909 RepID=R7U2H0_CAPTE|nr:hypothetical protein CAPTEDRAFT_210456 [Capitella teleta]|eukprot:ELT97836.1 hypothetical protein CAPTEDRAFT_210456 [Capitella teleta]
MLNNFAAQSYLQTASSSAYSEYDPTAAAANQAVMQHGYYGATLDLSTRMAASTSAHFLQAPTPDQGKRKRKMGSAAGDSEDDDTDFGQDDGSRGDYSDGGGRFKSDAEITEKERLARRGPSHGPTAQEKSQRASAL